MDADRFLLERFDDGGALLELDSGLLFRLNRSAAEIWGLAMQSRDTESIALHLTTAFGISPETARADVATTLSLPRDQVLPPRLTELTYEAQAGGYLFSLNGVPAMEMDDEKSSLRVRPGISAADYGVCLRAVAPKLVARTGPLVLHAAAVSSPDDRVMAFVGVNGAGKTTTARTFAANGFELICEDKLVAQVTGESVVAVIDGERKINQWIRETRQSLDLQPTRLCDTTALANCSAGPSRPLESVFLVDSGRRAGDSIQLRALPQSEAASAMFQHAFYGSGLAQDWRTQLACVATLARTARVFVATMPAGLEGLERAVRDYTETMAS
jgi:Coenzyme PQQ synthesis protein D (PqqD)